MEPVTRAATAADFEAMLALWRGLSDDLAEGEAARAIYAELIGRPGVTVFLAEDADEAGTPAATATLVVVPNLTRHGRPYALIENVVARADWRRSGLGRAVMRRALAAAWAAGCYKVMLLSGRSEASGVPLFYESLGFRRDLKTAYQINHPDRDTDHAPDHAPDRGRDPGRDAGHPAG
jgi:GNAT superfamily N-acetyltransferase